MTAASVRPGAVGGGYSGPRPDIAAGAVTAQTLRAVARTKVSSLGRSGRGILISGLRPSDSMTFRRTSCSKLAELKNIRAWRRDRWDSAAARYEAPSYLRSIESIAGKTCTQSTKNRSKAEKHTARAVRPQPTW